MANRRCFLYLTRQITSSLSSSGRSLQSLKTGFPILPKVPTQNPNYQPNFCNRRPNCYPLHTPARRFCSNMRDETGNDEDEDDDDEDDEGVDYESDTAANCGGSKREYTAEEREEGAAAIGYKVIGPLDQSDGVFKPYEPIFAVVQIGSHQFKVSNGDSIYTERLKFCEVNDKLILNKVLMLGSRVQTIIGRPILPNAAVHAVVEEHALDAKVIIFKKKRRKNYRRTKGHRQELTKLRITDVQGIEKPELSASGDGKRVAAVKKPEKEKAAFPAYEKRPEKIALPA